MVSGEGEPKREQYTINTIGLDAARYLNSTTRNSLFASAIEVPICKMDQKLKVFTLENKNFTGWRSIVEVYFELHDVLDLVKDESAAKKYLQTEAGARKVTKIEEYEDFHSKNLLARKAIMQNVSPKILEKIMHFKTANEMWLCLHRMFILKIKSTKDAARRELHALNFRLEGDMEKYCNIFDHLLANYL